MHGADESRLSGIVSQRPANVANENVQPRGIDVAVGPDGCMQLVLSQDFRPVTQKRREQLERLPRQVHIFVVSKEAARLRIEREGAEVRLHVRTLKLANSWIFFRTLTPAAAP
jgi:hypothetical protein